MKDHPKTGKDFQEHIGNKGLVSRIWTEIYTPNIFFKKGKIF